MMPTGWLDTLDHWDDEPTIVERSESWLATNFAEIPAYQAPVSGRYDNNDVTAVLPAMGGDER